MYKYVHMYLINVAHVNLDRSTLIALYNFNQTIDCILNLGDIHNKFAHIAHDGIRSEMYSH